MMAVLLPQGGSITVTLVSAVTSTRLMRGLNAAPRWLASMSVKRLMQSNVT